MNYHEFIMKCMEGIKPRLSDGEEIESYKTLKNNDIIYQGLLFKNSKTNASPIIYLEPYYELYQKGHSLECIIDHIWTAYHEVLPQKKIRLDYFHDFDKLKEHIFYMLINYEKNKNRLHNVPHVRFFDLAIVFYYQCYFEDLGEGTILIHNQHLNFWNITAAEVEKVAKINTPKLFPPMFCTLDQMLANLDTASDCYVQYKSPLYFLSNQEKTFGASAILYPEMLSTIGDFFQKSFYILPSSIHECLILPEDVTTAYFKVQLHNMIATINCTGLPKDEILSNYPLFYNYQTKTLRQITEEELR